MTNAGFNGFPANTAAPPALDARYAAAIPPTPAAGNYFYTSSDAGNSTSAGLGTGTLRLVPWLVGRTVTVDRLGAEVTIIGDVASKYRLGIYLDNGFCYPGNLLVDAGTIAGDSATVQTVTISPITLPPGLYWIGGVVQAVSVTQPTLRIIATWVPPVHIPVGTSTPGTGQSAFGFSMTGATAALPSLFSTTLSLAGSAARVFARTA